jgi:hypothetical protein
VPRVATTPDRHDIRGTIGARIGFIRRHYSVAPGLYAVGSPTPQDPVLVTANYKLSFDALRHRLTGLDAWILVVDTRGINVWCAAGKKTFSSQEVIESVRRCGLGDVVDHRELILPQLAAAGVSARAVQKGSGWSVLFGPVRSADLPRYLQTGRVADETMREVTFTLRERLALIPVELFLLGKPLVVLVFAGFVLSGIGPELFSLTAAWHRGMSFLAATFLGILSGAILTPLLLPWLPPRQFWVKGVWSALPFAACAFAVTPTLSPFERAALALWIVTVSSSLAMNFTGSTPFTSPSGVEREMRRGLPCHCLAVLSTCALWLIAPFWV